MAGGEGFEPPILGPEPSALPLGQPPSKAHETNLKVFLIAPGFGQAEVSGCSFPFVQRNNRGIVPAERCFYQADVRALDHEPRRGRILCYLSAFFFDIVTCVDKLILN